MPQLSRIQRENLEIGQVSQSISPSGEKVESSPVGEPRPSVFPCGEFLGSGVHLFMGVWEFPTFGTLRCWKNREFGESGELLFVNCQRGSPLRVARWDF